MAEQTTCFVRLNRNVQEEMLPDIFPILFAYLHMFNFLCEHRSFIVDIGDGYAHTCHPTVGRSSIISRYHCEVVRVIVLVVII